MSKHDAKKVLKNKHNSLIELPGLYSSLWLHHGKHERQTRILITAGAGCCDLSSSPKTGCLNCITRQKVQMMHLVCHYLETFPLLERA